MFRKRIVVLGLMFALTGGLFTIAASTLLSIKAERAEKEKERDVWWEDLENNHSERLLEIAMSFYEIGYEHGRTSVPFREEFVFLRRDDNQGLFYRLLANTYWQGYDHGKRGVENKAALWRSKGGNLNLSDLSD